MSKAIDFKIQPVSKGTDSAAHHAANDLIERLYAHGILDFLRALAGSGGDLADRLSQAADSPQGLRMMKNGIALFSILGSVDLEKLPPSTAELPTLWSLAKRLAGPDSRRALAAIIGALEATGRALDRKNS